MVYGRLYQEYQNIFSYFSVEYTTVPCTKLCSPFVLFKFIIGINQKQLTRKTKICKICYYRDHGGLSTAPHSLPQLSVTLSNSPRPLAATRSILQTPRPSPMVYCSCMELTQKNASLRIELAPKKTTPWKFTLLTIKPRLECSIHT
jgi:hypothetical protein